MRRMMTALIAFSTCTAALAAPVLYRPSQEFRTINAATYEVVVQKDGRVDVVMRSGEVTMGNVFPMVWFENESEPEALPLDGRFTSREQVNDRLGEGQGMVFKKKQCEWAIRTYPDKPFFTCQVAYVNDGKKPVRIRALMPWCTDGKRKGGVALGSEKTLPLTLANNPGFADGPFTPSLTTGDVDSLGNVACYHPDSGRSLIAGFLTCDSAVTRVELRRTPKAEGFNFDVIRASCVFDPPVEVLPGETLRSEVFYISVGERTPLEGLDRYGHAVAVVNEVRRDKPLLPHGWNSADTKLGRDISESALFAELEVMDRELKRHGWTHFAVGPGWEKNRGDWEPDPARFPRGLKPLVNDIHARGMTAGLWLDPFRVSRDSSLAAEHPDWLADPTEQGRAYLADDERILDITAPGVYAYVVDLFRKVSVEWGFDAVDTSDQVCGLVLAESYSDSTASKLDALRMGLRAMREGLGNDKSLSSTSPLVVAGMFAQTVELGKPTLPLWTTSRDGKVWGCVEAVENAARRYYHAPYLWTPDMGSAYFGGAATRKRWDLGNDNALTDRQSVAWLTAMAMMRGTVKTGDAFTDLNAEELGVLRRLLPVPERPACPLDLFNEGAPKLWSLPLETPAGEWFITGVFNWSTDTPQKTTLYLGQLGMNPGKVYTVYDFWADKYFGLAHGQLNIETAPGAVRLLCFREYEERPMFLSVDSHFTQGATDITALAWDGARGELRGTLQAVQNTPYKIRILVPEKYAMKEVTLSEGSPHTEQDGRVLTIHVALEQAGPIQWTVRF